MNYELAKKLKDAGFPQSGDGNYLIGNIETDEGGIITTNSVYIPTLEELIEACGDRFISLHKYYHQWVCNEGMEVHQFDSQGSTPEEAVAKLWLELHK